jgi:1,4-dihydroxy-2-naphthoate octaprenyltransferase
MKDSNLNNWMMAFRPKTLTAALVPILLGVAYVVSISKGATLIQWWIPVLALLASIFIQIGTNLVNDAVDAEKGADTEARLGPVRVTQKGLLTRRQVFSMAGLSFGLAALCGVPLVVHGGWPILVVGLLSVLMGYSYTAGPFPLAYLGLGDVFVILFFGLIAVQGLVYLMTTTWVSESLLLGLQVGFLSTVLIAINNLRDVETDVQANKKTLPVRFGKRFARYEILVLLILPFVMNIYWGVRFGWWAALLPMLLFPLAVKLCKRIFLTEPSSVYNEFLAEAAKIQLGFGALLALGFWIC